MPVVRVLVVLLTALALALPGAAGAQTTAGGTPAETATNATTTVQPEVVEPQAGTPVPAQPGATTTVEPVPQPTTTAPATAGGAPATAGGVVITTNTATSDSGSGIDWALVIAIATAVLLLGTALLIALWQLRGWDPRWMRRWRHATAEAGWRLSLGWAEFRDFVRLGR